MEKLFTLSKEIYGKEPKGLRKIFKDVEGLYNGKCPLYEKCEVGYHTFNHAKDVALATAYMIAGWNKVNDDKIEKELFLIGITASLFHDAGYIKEKGDKKGKGGKFTFIHEPRSAKIAREYLKKNNYNKKFQKLVSDIILLTDFKDDPIIPEYFDEKEKAVASMVATADLIAQMADANYVESLNNLYEEMKEAYEFEGYDNLISKGIKVYKTPDELKENIWEFFESKVIPRLIKLGSVYKYLKYNFPAGRNPYGESILTNLTYQTSSKFKWERIGKLLEEMGNVKKEDIEEAIQKYKDSLTKHCRGEYSNKNLMSVIKWLEKNSGESCIGDILIKMGAVENSDIRKAFQAQLLPDNLIKNIQLKDWPKIVLTGMLLVKIRDLPQIFTQVLEIVNELLECECSSILLADESTKTLNFIVATGPHKDELKDVSIPIDKGVAGWVYFNKKYAIINEVNYDERFSDFIDKTLDFKTRSILAVPLFYNGEIVGVIEAVNKNNGIFEKRDVAILTIFSNQISLCLDTMLWIREKVKEEYEKKK